MESKNILVTGAAGFIGYHLIKSLCKDNHQVIGLDNLNDYYDKDLKLLRLKEIKSDAFKFFEADINDEKSLIKIFEEFKFDRVIHLAAQAGVRYSLINPIAYSDSNLSGFTKIIDLAKNFDIDHFVYASSSSVYGKSDKVPFKKAIQ